MPFWASERSSSLQAKRKGATAYRERCERADAREEARATRTPQEQLKLIDSRPGESRKERARLVSQVARTMRSGW